MIDYNPHDWRSHLWDIRGSMFREIFSRVMLCALWAVLLVCIDRLWYLPELPTTGHTLVGVALGLLLVFRTNASYDRFWEGRRLWGTIVNTCRGISRFAAVYLESHPDLQTALDRWTIAFPWATMHRLRGSNGLGPNAAELDPVDVQNILAARHPVLEVSNRMSRVVAEAHAQGQLTDQLTAYGESLIQTLIDCLGGCERIHSTPLPFAYVVHLRRALIVYCYSLPFALVREFGWGTIVVTWLIAYTLFGIEEIGVEIEDPFGDDENDLPLERTCQTIEADVRTNLRSRHQLAASGDSADGAGAIDERN